LAEVRIRSVSAGTDRPGNDSFPRSEFGRARARSASCSMITAKASRNVSKPIGLVSSFPVPRMVRIERVAVHIASADAFGREALLPLLLTACLFVVMRYAARHQMIQRRVGIATPRDRHDMIDDRGSLDPAGVQAVLAQRVPLQLVLAQAMPSLCRVGPNCHHVHPIKVRISMTGPGRAATPTAIVSATNGSMRPVDLRLDNFLFPAASISTLALAAAIQSTG
jgi:hypothetical protein